MSTIPPPPPGGPAPPPPWPPPGVKPPGEPGVDPAAASAAAFAGEPFDDELFDDDDEGFDVPAWAFVLIPLLIVALIGFLIWRANSSDEESTTATTLPVSSSPAKGSGAGTTLPGAGSTLPGAGTTLPGAGTTLPAAPPTQTPSSIAGPSTSAASTVTTAGSPTVTSPATTAVSRPPTQSPAPRPPAVVLAQDMASALARGDWAAVRRLSPTDQRTNAQFERDYAGLDRSTIVPVTLITLSSGLVDLRLGLVAHESRPSGAQTSLFCAHWIIDPVNDTVQRLSAQMLRTEGGTTPPPQVAPELRATCATLPLR